MSEQLTSNIPDGVVFNALDKGQQPTDILFSEIAALTPSLVPTLQVIEAKYNMPYAYISNQYSTPDCTAHSQAGSVNENNGREASIHNAVPDAKLINPVWLGEFGHQVGKITKDGGYINWALGYLIKWGYISGYTVVGRTPQEIKQAILRNGALVTGSNSISWSSFDDGWIARNVPNSPGHAFRIDGWDDSRQAFRVANSWGESWGDGGFFWVKYSDIGLLFTIYALHDVDDTSHLLRAKAKNLGIWNGERGNEVATRSETVLIASRIAGKVGTNYDILTMAKMNKVWNGERPDDKVSLFEAKLMFERLGVTKSPKGVTRGELAECIN